MKAYVQVQDVRCTDEKSGHSTATLDMLEPPPYFPVPFSSNNADGFKAQNKTSDFM